jgi:mono/diheme cytochrome c family protein
METQDRFKYVSVILNSFVFALVLLGIGAIQTVEAEPAPVVKPAPQSSLTGNAESGEQMWFDYYCYSCHGTAGNGGAAPRVSNTPRTMEGFIQYVRNPARMPPYINRVMSDQQLADVYEFLQGLPASPTVDEIPLLKELMDGQ